MKFVKYSYIPAFVVVVFLIAAGKGDGFDLPRYAVKKVHKTLEDIWPEKSADISKVAVGKKERKEASVPDEKADLYTIKHQEKLLGYLCMDEAPSKSRTFDYMVVFSPDLTIKRVKVLIYRENYGGEIGSKRWLQQFIGKKKGQNMELRQDIQGISGATISARSLTRNVKELAENIAKLKEAGVL